MFSPEPPTEPATTPSLLYTPSANTLAPPTKILTPTASSNTASSSSGANAIPLSAFTNYKTVTEALSINHQGQFPSVTISFNLAPNAALGSAITAIEKTAAEMHFPPSLQNDFQGTAASFKK